MEKRKFEICREEIFYYVFWAILMGSKGLGLDQNQTIFQLLILIAYGSLFIKLILTKHSLLEWGIILLMTGLALCIRHQSGETAAIATVLTIAGMKNIPLKRILYVTGGVWAAAFLFTISRALIGIAPGVIVVHPKLGLGPIIRYSLGFTHPNVLHISYAIFVILMLYMGNFHGKKLLKMSAIFFVGNLYIFLYSISYTGIIIVTGYLALNLYLDIRKKLCKAEKILLGMIFPFCVLFALGGPFILKGKAFEFFDDLLSTRFSLVYNLFRENPISLFGTRIVLEEGSHLTLDSSYAYLLMYYGIIAFILLMAGYFFTTLYFIKREKKKETAILVCIAVAGITEQFLFNLSFKNISLFFIGFCLYEALKKWERNRQYSALPEKKYVIAYPEKSILIFKGWVEVYRSKKKVILTIGIITTLLISGCLAFNINMPESVIVQRGILDYRSDEEFCATEEELAENYPNSMILEYQGPDVGLYEFKGSIITVEYVRRIVSIFLYTGVFAVIFLGTGFYIYSRGQCKLPKSQ